MFGNTKKKIYISGKISGLDYKEAGDIFQAKETELLENGYLVVNPFKIAPEAKELKEGGKPSWSDFMRADIRELCLCDEIYMLDNWKTSKGAAIELELALNLEIKVSWSGNPDTEPYLAKMEGKHL